MCEPHRSFGDMESSVRACRPPRTQLREDGPWQCDRSLRVIRMASTGPLLATPGPRCSCDTPSHTASSQGRPTAILTDALVRMRGALIHVFAPRYQDPATRVWTRTLFLRCLQRLPLHLPLRRLFHLPVFLFHHSSSPASHLFLPVIRLLFFFSLAPPSAEFPSPQSTVFPPLSVLSQVSQPISRSPLRSRVSAVHGHPSRPVSLSFLISSPICHLLGP
ncbi:hypothetical protein C7974DRAFT_85406 [Boeremia exigua]|uniref:uncharacterized protein n=1 Tax=Boeremia exigua TaxID=749465 RepID=UPI001E8CA984|nr:uncharacterized protein C7974DRAFT_85406 [Boeremia exigua]KAH6611824.1 hypothetical protein C7974DRAFT_85406 [Boeremia exigua]